MTNTIRPLGNNWFSGRIDHDGTAYTFEALAFAEGSRFGIGGGCVSKLTIAQSAPDGEPRSWAKPVYSYDRSPHRGKDVNHAPTELLDAVLTMIGQATGYGRGETETP